MIQRYNNNFYIHEMSGLFFFTFIGLISDQTRTIVIYLEKNILKNKYFWCKWRLSWEVNLHILTISLSDA